MRVKKRTKSSRRHAHQTAFRGAKERTRHSGNRGGYGMAGTGKRGDQKKTLVINQTGGNNYFGKSRTLRRGPVPQKLKVINLDNLSRNYADAKEVSLSGYKILGSGDLTIKAKIHASAASVSAQEKIKKSGSELILEKAA
ncbi:uL15 family ribosomal protein [Candidatus Pacearchaeota archaeon]|nr:uL15 family ribosomal protein [Candidatus Pacearchaeota archaeon]